MTDPEVRQRSGVASLTGSRENNEDAYLVRDGGHGAGAALAALAVADGMGGYDDGQVASRMAVDMAAGALGDGTADSAAIKETFGRVDDEIRAVSLAGGGGHSMGTTLTFAVVRDGEAVVGHVGDTRAWLFHQGDLQQITVDHSRVGRLVRAGVITEQDAIGHPEANVLEQALGAGERPSTDVYRVGVGPGDVLLLSSDGMHGTLSRDEIETTLRDHPSMQDVCDRLAAMALAKGSSDNVTVVAWRYPLPATRTPTNPGSVAPEPVPLPAPSAAPKGARARRQDRVRLLAGGFGAGFVLGLCLQVWGR